MKPQLITVGYRARSGKDTVADHLVEHHGFKKVSWAGLLKEGVNSWHGWDDRHSFGDLKEVVDPYWGYSPREAYQKIGTDLMRERWSGTFWVQAAMRKIGDLMESGFSVVISDSRFPNEVNAVLCAGGQVWRVDRPGLVQSIPAPKNRLVRWFMTKILGKKYDHLSETGLLGYDAWHEVIINDGSIKDLHLQVDRLVPWAFHVD